MKQALLFWIFGCAFFLAAFAQEVAPTSATFDALARKHRVQVTHLGGYKVECIEFSETVKVENPWAREDEPPTIDIDYFHAYYRVGNIVLDQVSNADYAIDSPFLKTLKKIFLFPDGSLGLILFEVFQGHFNTGSPCSGGTQLDINILRIVKSEPEGVFYLIDDSCQDGLRFYGKNDLEAIAPGPDYALDSIFWVDDHTIRLALEEMGEGKYNAYNVTFITAFNQIAVQTHRVD